MRLIATESLHPGDKLSKAIYTENGYILIQEGVALTKRMIDRLDEFGITYVYIEEDKTDDIQSQYPISEKVRREAIQTIHETFQDIKDSEKVTKGFVFEKTAKKMMSMVRHILQELQNNKEVISLLSDVFTYDDYVFTHSLNVTIYSLALATELKLPPKKIEQIGLGAMLHDVGKMFVPRDVLLKPGRLTDEEFELIKKHSEDGFNILRNVANIPLVAAHCAYQHHERLDGSGYPRGLKGNEIHEYAKIIGIADVFDAVTSNRVYRNAMLPHEGMEILYAGADRLFAKELVESFRRSVAVYPNGLSVILSDGRKGIVSKQNAKICDRPIIRILEENGLSVNEPYEINLAKELNIVITECDTTFVRKKV